MWRLGSKRTLKSGVLHKLRYTVLMRPHCQDTWRRTYYGYLVGCCSATRTTTVWTRRSSRTLVWSLMARRGRCQGGTGLDGLSYDVPRHVSGLHQDNSRCRLDRISTPAAAMVVLAVHDCADENWHRVVRAELCTTMLRRTCLRWGPSRLIDG
jgi:hypothetical protein